MEIRRCPWCGGAGSITYVPRCSVCGGPTESGAGCEFCPRIGEAITVQCIVCGGLGTVSECPACGGAGDACKRCNGFGYVPAKGPGSWPEAA
jgi:hypothetical protein